MNKERVDTIVDIVTKSFGVSLAECVGKSHERRVCIVRYFLFLYLHKNENIPAEELGRMFNRHRVNVLRGIRVIEGWIQFHADVKAKYASILTILKEYGY